MTPRTSLARRLLAATLVASFAFTFAPLAASADTGDWLIRLRGINVSPDDSSSAVRSNGSAIGGSSVSVDDDTVPELDITYFVRPNWGLELILATSEHNVSAEGSLSALGEIVTSDVLPPTLLLQYHFAPDARIRPYVGLGVNFTLFFDEEASASFEAAAGGSSDVDLDSSVGLAGQLGVDVGLNDDWFLNFDVKYLDLQTDATIETPGALGTVEVDVDINPIVWGFGFGRRF
ncbi:MAG: OmpW family protein [Acidobacteriota bacterium]